MKSIRSVLWLALFLFGAAPGAQSQPASPTPAPPPSAVFVVTHIGVSAAGIPDAIGLLGRYRDALAQAGTPNVDLYQELGRPDRFAIVEQWQDRPALDAKRPGAAAMLAAGLKDIQSAPPDSQIFQGFSVAPIRPPGGGRAKVHGLSHFEIPAARLTEFDALVKPYLEASRTDAGGMRFDLLKGQGPRQNQFTIVESWSNPQDFESHRNSAPVKKFREGLAPMLTGPFDDRLYGKFN